MSNKGITTLHVSSLLLNGGTVLSNQVDVQTYVDQAHKDLGNPSQRGSAFAILALYFEVNSEDKKIIKILDRLQVFLETLKVHEQDSLLQLMQSLANVDSPEVLNYWSKIISKIVSQSLKSAYANKEDMNKIVFTFDFFRILLESKLRTMLIPNIKSIRDLCCSYLLDHDIQYVSVISRVFALVSSIESADGWVSTFSVLSDDLMSCLKKLQLNLPILKKSSQQQNPSFLSWESISTMNGVTKSITVNLVFQRLCSMLQEMLFVGCSSGFVNIDLSKFLDLHANLIPYTLNANTSDAKNFVENDEKVSVVDIAFVLSQLKISMLKTLTALLKLNLPIFIRFGTTMIQPLFSLLAKQEVHLVPDLLEECLQCLKIAIQTLPNTVAKVIENGSSVLQDLFSLQINLVASNRSMVTALPSTTTNKSHTTLGKRKSREDQDVEEENDRVSVVVFEVVESLLLYGAILLPVAVRDLLERLVKLGLSSLEKGIINPTLSDRRLKRNRCERIRQSVVLQTAFLSLALSEVIAPSRSGILSNNIPRFRAVCTTLVMSNNASSNLKNQASKALLTIGHLLQPTLIPVPHLAPSTLTSRFMVELSKEPSAEIQAMKAAEGKVSFEVAKNIPTPAVANSSVSLINSNQPMSQVPQFVEVSSVKESSMNVELPESSKQNFEVPDIKFSSVMTKRVANNANATKPSADNEDEELPDIDIDSD